MGQGPMDEWSNFMSDIGQRLIAIVRQKAAAAPDFVYNPPIEEKGTCVYVHDGKPSCLIGQALWGAGLIDASLEDSAYNTETSSPLISGYLSLIDIGINELTWLRAVQYKQDTRATWADAVAYADSGDNDPLAKEWVA